MAGIKQEVIQLVQSLPETATFYALMGDAEAARGAGGR